MALATLFCILFDYDFQPKQLQPRRLTRVNRPPLVARYDCCGYWICDPDCPRGTQQPRSDQVLHRIPGLCTRGGRCSWSQLIHLGSSSSGYHLLRDASVFMRGIFGNGYHNIPNHLPASAGITSRDLLSFFLFWIVRHSPLIMLDLR
jgi:hypothetical protein